MNQEAFCYSVRLLRGIFKPYLFLRARFLRGVLSFTSLISLIFLHNDFRNLSLNCVHSLRKKGKYYIRGR